MNPAKWARRERENTRMLPLHSARFRQSLAKSVADRVLQSFEEALSRGIREAQERADLRLYGGAAGGGMASFTWIDENGEVKP